MERFGRMLNGAATGTVMIGVLGGVLGAVLGSICEFTHLAFSDFALGNDPPAVWRLVWAAAQRLAVVGAIAGCAGGLVSGAIGGTVATSREEMIDEIGLSGYVAIGITIVWFGLLILSAIVQWIVGWRIAEWPEGVVSSTMISAFSLMVLASLLRSIGLRGH